MVTVPGNDRFEAFKFNENDPITVPITNIPLYGIKISSHFIINVIFKLEEIKSSYIFSIDDRNNDIQLGIDLTPAGEDITRITFHCKNLPQKIAQTLIHSNLKEKWTKLMIEVNSDTIIFYENCEEHEVLKIDEDIDELIISDDAKVHLAYGGPERKGFFQVGG